MNQRFPPMTNLLSYAVLVFFACAMCAEQSVHSQELDRQQGILSDIRYEHSQIFSEPSYQKTPRYLLLVFGEDAKDRIWIAVDGDVAYADVNGDREFDETREKFLNNEAISEDYNQDDGVDGVSYRFFEFGEPGKTSVSLKLVDYSMDSPPESHSFRDKCRKNGWVNGVLFFQWNNGVNGESTVYLCESPGDCQVCWIDGKLRMACENSNLSPGVNLLKCYLCTSVLPPKGYQDRELITPYPQPLIPVGLVPQCNLLNNGDVSQLSFRRNEDSNSFELDLYVPGNPQKSVDVSLSFPEWRHGNVDPGIFSLPIIDQRPEWQQVRVNWLADQVTERERSLLVMRAELELARLRSGVDEVLTVAELRQQLESATDSPNTPLRVIEIYKIRLSLAQQAAKIR